MNLIAFLQHRKGKMKIKLVFQEVTKLEDMLPNYALVKELSPKLTKRLYTAYLKRMVIQGYRQLLVYEGGELVAMSGVWIGTKLYCGTYLEIDNFIVKEANRSGGLGSRIVREIEKIAAREGCQFIMLDAYVQNFKAHKFYYANGFKATGFHYMKRVLETV